MNFKLQRNSSTTSSTSHDYNTPFSYLMNNRSHNIRNSASTARIASSSTNSIFTEANDENRDDRFYHDLDEDDTCQLRSQATLTPSASSSRISATKIPGSSLLRTTSGRLQINVLTRARITYCFCGLPADIVDDSDSIYCSVKCGREDAMSSLCGDPGEENVGLGLGLGSSSSESLHSLGSKSANGGGSHYRRIELAETQKAIDKAKEQGIERTATGVWRYHKSNGAKKNPSPTRRIVSPIIESSTPEQFPSPHIPLPLPPRPTEQPFAPLTSYKTSSRSTPVRLSTARSSPMGRGNSHAPNASTSTTRSMAPSLSTSSTASYTSSRTYSSSSSRRSSPLSPRFSPHSQHQPNHSYSTSVSSSSSKFTHSPLANDYECNSDIYADYAMMDVSTEQQAFDSPSLFYDRFGSMYIDEEDEEVYNQGGGRRGVEEQQDEEEYVLEEEERDQVNAVLDFGSSELLHRVGSSNAQSKSRQMARGHQKGLSFDDVVGIMQAQ